MNLTFPLCIAKFLSVFSLYFLCDGQAQAQDPLTVDRIYGSSEFRAEGFSANWAPDTDQFWTFETDRAGVRGDLVFVDPRTDEKSVFMSEKQLVPDGRSRPLPVSEFYPSGDNQQVLIYTNTRRVWRYNTRGDYWVLDRESNRLRQLGKGFPESTLMFAKLLPDGKRVAYVQDRNIHLEEIETGKIRQLTERNHDEIINGTSDWVYEEELDVRDGFRVSPDGKRIAYWQFDTSGLEEFTLINNTDSLYPALKKFKYPKAGTVNSAVRAGAVDLDSGQTTWFELPGDPRNHYIARIDWIDSTRLLVQQLNRQQNQNRVYIVDAGTGRARKLWVDTDAAWVDVNDDLFWLAGRKKCTWVSERDGWKQIYLLDLENGELKQVTRGQYDVFEIVRFDEQLSLIHI